MSTNETPNSLHRTAFLLIVAGADVTGQNYPIRRADREFFMVSVTLSSGSVTIQGRIGNQPWYPLIAEGEDPMNNGAIDTSGLYVFRKVPGQIRAVTNALAANVTVVGDA